MLHAFMVETDNKALCEIRWPSVWKEETVKIIPKARIPASLKDVRNISCTPLFSKVLEGFILKELRREFPLSKNQYGGVPGTSIDHFLCETWHEVMTGLEDKSAAMNLLSIDFSKAFNRMDHQACLSSLERSNVNPHLVGMVHAFLYKRKMAVHVNGKISRFEAAPGGAPQGSVLGSYLFCAVTQALGGANVGNVTPNFSENGLELSIPTASPSNSNRSADSVNPIMAPHRASSPLNLETLGEQISSDDEDVNLAGRERRRIEDLDSTIHSFRPTQEELEMELELSEWDYHEQPSIKAYVDDYNVIEKVRTTGAASHFTEGKPKYEVHANLSEGVFKKVKNDSADLGMLVNDDKTQLLCIHHLGNQMSSYIHLDDGTRIKSSQTLKILGFTFGQKPDVSENTSLLVNKTSSMLWGLRHLKRSRMRQENLLQVYKAVVRPVLDFAAVAYHSILTKRQAEEIERLQLRSMKIVFGDTVSYRTVISSGQIETLEERRTKLLEKFALKTANNPRFKDTWFPINPDIEHDLRRREKYIIPRMLTERGFKSPIIAMRRILNKVR